MRIRYLIVFFVVFLLLMAGYFFRPRKTPRLSATVVRRDLSLTTSVSGKVKLAQEADLSFPISGRLTKIESEGETARTGDVLAELDTFDLYSAYQAALSNLNKSRSSYSNLVEAKAELDATYAGQETSNFVKAKLAEGKTNVEAAAAATENAKFLADEALANLTKAIIRAPFSGQVGVVDFKIGEVPPLGRRVLTLVDLSTLYFEAEVDEVDIGDLKVDQPATLKLDALREASFEGKVYAIDQVSHVTSSGGTAYNVRISIGNDPAHSLKPGFNGEAQILREIKKGVLVIPASFVTQKDGKNFVEVSEPGKVMEKEVRLGLLAGDSDEVLGGLAAGEEIFLTHKK